MASMLWSCVTDFFTYETTKSVVVKSWSVGIVNRIVQLLIIIYFVGWVFIHEKAYQVIDTGIESAVMTKVKGFGYHDNQTMDVADYVSPPQGAAVFCIITKLIVTKNQHQGRCAETHGLYKCDTDVDCQRKFGANLGNGAITGVCLKSSNKSNATNESIGTNGTNESTGTNRTNESTGTNETNVSNGTNESTGTSGTCEIQGWCPTENDQVKRKPMLDVKNFTIFIKNSIRFPLFDVTRGNFPQHMTREQIKSCKYHPVDNPLCPIFLVGDVLNYTGQDVASLAEEGGEIGINIEWKCNLDFDIEKCQPKYSFTRLDAPFAKNKISKGYNFRFAKYFKHENGIEYRTLHKAIAIRFDIMVTGNAGKFNTIPTLINLVAAFTSVGLGTVLCDIILLNFLKGADQYKAKKFEEVSKAQIEESLAQKQGSQLSITPAMKCSYDSGALSLSAEQAV